MKASRERIIFSSAAVQTSAAVSSATSGGFPALEAVKAL